VRAREPIERPAFGVSDSQDEQVLLVLFERDQVGEQLYGGLADQRIYRPRARPCRVGFFFPEGVLFDGNKLVGTGTTLPVFNYLNPISDGEK